MWDVFQTVIAWVVTTIVVAATVALFWLDHLSARRHKAQCDELARRAEEFDSREKL